jgi:hypothetical protein
VARALGLLQVKLGWSSESEAGDVTLANFTPVVIALYRAAGAEHPRVSDRGEDVGKVLARFEDWYATTYHVSFWMLFDNPIPDTPRVDF